MVVKEEFNFDKFAQDVDLLTKICGQLMKTKHYAALGEAGIFAILQRAKAMNIDPFDCLNGGLYYINGKVGMSTELMASLIRRQGHQIIKDPSSNDTICTLHGKRADNGDEWTSTFSMADADRAGLKKNMFLKYPAIMLYNRAMSALARQLFPDVIKGAGYEKDELEEIAPCKNVRDSQPSITIGPIPSDHGTITLKGGGGDSILISDKIQEYPPMICTGVAKSQYKPEIPVTEEQEKEFLEKFKLALPAYREQVESYILNNLGKTRIQDVTMKSYNKLMASLDQHLATGKELDKEG